MSDTPSIMDKVHEVEEQISESNHETFQGVSAEDKKTIVNSLIDLDTNLNAKTDLTPNQIVQIMRAEKYGEMMEKDQYSEITELLKELVISKNRLGRVEIKEIATHEEKSKAQEKQGLWGQIFNIK